MDAHGGLEPAHPGQRARIYAASIAGAEFFVDHAWVRIPLGPSGPVGGPPIRTVTWFHVGPVGAESRNWAAELDWLGEYWRGDPPLVDHVDFGALPAGSSRRAHREAVRSLRGRVLRTEWYAEDGTTRAGRPYEVHDFAYQVAPILDGRRGADPAWQAQPVVTVRTVLSRTTVWERGDDPMTRLQLTGRYDDYGRPHASVEIGVSRGRDPRRAGPPCLATLTTTDYATRDDAGVHLLDRVLPNRPPRVTDKGTLPVVAFALEALRGTPNSDLRALDLTYYDGVAFKGLDIGELGNHGLPVRSERLVITPTRLDLARQPAGADGPGMPVPPYLSLDGNQPPPASWPMEYPTAFQQAVLGGPASRGPALGYVWHSAGSGVVAGYYAQTSRCCYDVQALSVVKPAPGPGHRLSRRLRRRNHD